MGSCWSIFSFVYCFVDHWLWIIDCLIVLFLLTILFPVLWFKASDYPFWSLQIFFRAIRLQNVFLISNTLKGPKFICAHYYGVYLQFQPCFIYIVVVSIYWWKKKPEYLEKISDFLQVTDKLCTCIKLNDFFFTTLHTQFHW